MKQLTITGLRLIAIWFFLKALGYIQFVPIFFTNRQDLSSSALGMIIVLLIYIVTAGLLYFKAPYLATIISSSYEETTIQISNYERLAAILFASVGLLIFFDAFTTFISSVGRVYNGSAATPQDSQQLVRTLRTLVFGGGIQMILGACLFVGGKKLASWWYAFRNWT